MCYIVHGRRTFLNWGRGGGVRLKVGHHPLKVISPTASWIRWRMQVYAGVCGDLMWTCLVWANDLRLTVFGVPSHRLNSATGEQKGVSQTIALTPSLPVGCLTHLCQAPK